MSINTISYEVDNETNKDGWNYSFTETVVEI